MGRAAGREDAAVGPAALRGPEAHYRRHDRSCRSSQLARGGGICKNVCGTMFPAGWGIVPRCWAGLAAFWRRACEKEAREREKEVARRQTHRGRAGVLRVPFFVVSKFIFAVFGFAFDLIVKRILSLQAV